MMYVKGILIGVAASVIASVFYIVISVAIMLRRYSPPPGAEAGFDVRAFFYSSSFWLIALLAFVLGIWWMFRQRRRA
jgi:hypothetical protein